MHWRVSGRVLQLPSEAAATSTGAHSLRLQIPHPSVAQTFDKIFLEQVTTIITTDKISFRVFFHWASPRKV